MANIHLSLAGEGRGHATRARTLVEGLRGRHTLTLHTFGDAHDFLEPLYRAARDVDVRAIPGLRFRYDRRGRVDYVRTTIAATRELPALVRTTRDLAAELRRDGADLVLSDFEPMLPRAARRAGVPFVAIDHQSVLRHGDFAAMPRSLRRTAGHLGRFVGSWMPTPDLQISSSFYRPHPRAGSEAVRFVGVLLRDVVRDVRPTQGEHVVAYVRKGTSDSTLDVLRAAPVEVRAYGLGDRPAGGALVPRPISEEGFAADLASCRALVTSAGNQLVGEALHLGKPVLALPERGNREQEINAWFLERSGAGIATPCATFTGAVLRSFLGSVPRYRRAAEALDVDGTTATFELVEAYLRPAWPDPIPAPLRAATA